MNKYKQIKLIDLFDAYIKIRHNVTIYRSVMAMYFFRGHLPFPPLASCPLSRNS